MSGLVYALLAGIDNYPASVNGLRGCLNDVAAFEEILKLRVPAGTLRLETLRDRQATRAAVIARFQQHLGLAGPDDVALFYYAGHGSQERAPEPFWVAEPDHLNETLVLWDSREEGQWDLADKELNGLIGAVAAKGAHVAVILDCCHSGSGTRALVDDDAPRIRRIPPSRRDRPMATFTPEAQAMAQAKPAGAPPPHILLAACRDDQEASEYSGGGRTRGAFSYFLSESIQEAAGAVTYGELGAIARAKVSVAIANQVPQIESVGGGDLDRPFLGGAIQPRPIFYIVTQRDGAWSMDAGRILGIPAPSGGEFARVALFPSSAGEAAMKKVGGAAAIAEVVEVGPASSRLRVASGKLTGGKTYKARAIGTPLKARGVQLSGDAGAVAELRDKLKNCQDVAEVSTNPTFRVECAPGKFVIYQGAGTRALAAPEDSAGRAAADLDHMACWMNFAELENPSSAIRKDEFRVRVLAGGSGETELDQRDIRLIGSRDPNVKPPQFRIEVSNRGKRTLYLSILALDEVYSCSTGAIEAGVVALKPREGPYTTIALKSRIPDDLRREGRTESRDIVKIILSTVDFAARNANLSALGGARGEKKKLKRPTNTLERMLSRTMARTISPVSPADTIGDFQTATLIVTTVEPLEKTPLSAAPADLGAGVRLLPHASLQASARLTTAAETRGDLDGALLPPIFRQADETSEPLRFSSARGAFGGLSVLELSDVANYQAVTPDNPLVMRLAAPLAPGDAVLPIAWDGEDYLPLGHSSPAGDETEIRLQRLPHPVYQRQRSLVGSIKIVFQKFSSALLGTKYDYPVLALAEWDAAGKVHFDNDPARIVERVAAAHRVVVFVHGIIGDTFGMGARLTPGADDAFLTFDYENLNTTIEQTAAGLKQRLAAVGLGEGHGKKLVMIAHSMGGLVSRWFIEQLGGDKIVSLLILCGTPNAGSPWSTAEDWVSGMVSLGINQLTHSPWTKALIRVVETSLPRIDNTLQEMRPGCALLQQLAASPEGGTPYAVLAGNASLVDLAAAGRVERLFKKVLYKTTSMAFLFRPNDIAVSVESIGAVGGRWQHAPRLFTVACDHISYFASDAGVDKLRELLGETPTAN